MDHLRGEKAVVAREKTAVPKKRARGTSANPKRSNRKGVHDEKTSRSVLETHAERTFIKSKKQSVDYYIKKKPSRDLRLLPDIRSGSRGGRPSQLERKGSETRRVQIALTGRFDSLDPYSLNAS